jgi:hypothetical protein
MASQQKLGLLPQRRIGAGAVDSFIFDACWSYLKSRPHQIDMHVERSTALTVSALRMRSCECYVVVKKEYGRLLPDLIALSALPDLAVRGRTLLHVRQAASDVPPRQASPQGLFQSRG